MTPFEKWHGAGNDFLLLDARNGLPPLPPARIAALADRRQGVGFDQLITLEPARAGADVFMRIHNADGGEAGACGNAARCVAARLARDTGRTRVAIETVSARLPATVEGAGRVSVGMGRPRFDWRAIPLAREADTLHLPLPGDPAACSMGNPHATFFAGDLGTETTRVGPALERDPIFLERANIGWARVEAPDRIRLRVWERGAGLTRACGSGACAAVVNAHRRGLVARTATVECDGGALEVTWCSDDTVTLTGPACFVFTGGVELSE